MRVGTRDGSLFCRSDIYGGIVYFPKGSRGEDVPASAFHVRGPMMPSAFSLEIGCLNGNYGLTTGTPVPVKAIDFVLYTPDEEMSPKAYDVYYDAYVESDHFPVVATFSIND